MTIGQRIAQKRKELALSQEALGETLSVSRQSIYKWESDAALPEIDKLIALSRLFGVSVGWLLGVEEDIATEPAPEPDGALTDAQLKMVEEIVGRYTAALPKQKAPKRSKWSVRLLFLLCGLMVGCLIGISEDVKQLSRQYNNLQNSVGNITHSVDSQINGISDRVEEILKAQNDLTADYGTEVLSADLAENQITFSVRAVPKTYVVDMWVEFSVDNGETCLYVPGDASHDEAFTAELTCDLTDSITLSAVFTQPDGTRQTQILDTYEGLYSASFPYVHIRDYQLFGRELENGQLPLREFYVTARSDEGGKQLEESGEIVTVANLQMGLFRNQKLVAWAKQVEQPDNFQGFEGETFYRIPDLTLEDLTAEDVIAVAAVVTDNYGRQFMACEVPYILEFKTSRDNPYLTYPSDGRYDSDPAHWEF